MKQLDYSAIEADKGFWSTRVYLSKRQWLYIAGFIVLYYINVGPIADLMGPGFDEKMSWQHFWTLIAAIVVPVFAVRHGNKTREGVLRRFAEDNNLEYARNGSIASKTSTLFKVGDGHYGLHVFRPRGDEYLFAEIATIGYWVGSGNLKTTFEYGVVRMKLPRPMPHILLDSKKNNFIFTNLPFGFTADQRITLEGDFNEHFDLFVPADYGVDVRYIFPPNIMEQLIRAATAFDIEIIENDLYIYTKGRLSPYTGKKFKEAVALCDELGKILARPMERYTDERSDVPLQVAKPGRSLKIRWTTSTVITAVALVLYVLILLT